MCRSSESFATAAVDLKTLVTGATGFVGARLAETLAGEGESVRLYVRDRGRIPRGLIGRCDIVEGDLCDAKTSAEAVAGMDVVIHCAANVKTWDTWEAYQAANVTGVRVLLEAIRGHCPALQRLVHVSTVDVYGYPVEPCDERCPLDGGGLGYGETKLAAERLVREYAARYGIPTVVLRPTNIIGPRSPFIARIGDALHHGVMLKIDGGQANAGVLYIDNLIRYLCWAATSPAAAGETFNVSDDHDVDWATLLSDLKRLIDGRGFVVNLSSPLAEGLAGAFAAFHRRWRPTREPLLHPLLVRMFGRTCGHSGQRLRAASGIDGAVGYEEGMARSAQWYLDQLKGRR